MRINNIPNNVILKCFNGYIDLEYKELKMGFIFSGTHCRDSYR